MTVSLDSARSEAARVAAFVDLRDIRLWQLSTELTTVPDDESSRLSYKFESDLQVQFDSEEAVLIVFGTYALDIDAVPLTPPSEGDSDTDSGERSQVATIHFKLNALFEMDRDPGEPFTESELIAFGQTTGQFALYPYVRELVADVTSRLGVPPLHMGVLRLHLDSRTGE